MAGPTRTPEQRERDLETTARMYCRGSTMQAIADYLEVTRQQIGYDWQVLLTRWRENADASIEDKLAAELEKINQVERTYWDAWERSLKPKDSTRKQSSKRGEESMILAETRSEQRDGEPRYLEGVRWCIEQRLKIIGGYAPAKVDLTTRIEPALEDVSAANAELETWERERIGFTPSEN